MNRIKDIKWDAKKVTGAVILVIALFAPIFINQSYWIHIMVMCALYAGLASSLNVILGYTGLFSLAHAAFFGIGAYTAGILSGKLGMPIWIGISLSGFFACFLGMIVGLPSLKLRGDYLAIVTMGFGQIMRLIELNAVELTNGAMGIPGIPKPVLFGEPFSKKAFYYMALLFTLAVIFAINRIVKSRIGRALIAIREDEAAAESIGINTTAFKVLAFGIGTFCAGLLGSVFAHYITFISPDQYAHNDSILMFCMVILGGQGTIIGPVVGGIILTIVPELMRIFAEYRIMIVGFVMVLCMVYRPQGIMGSYAGGNENKLSKKLRKLTVKGSGSV